MKRLVFLIAIITLIAGCAKIENQFQTEIETTDSEFPKVIYAGFADEEGNEPETRTFVKDDKNILWNQNDGISYFSGISHAQYMYLGDDGASKAEFTLDNDTYLHLEKEITGTVGLYPFNDEATCSYVQIATGTDNIASYHQITTKFPYEQVYAPNSFGKGANIMVASSDTEEDDKLFFHNACGYLVIKLYGEGTNVKSVKVTALNGVAKLAGPVEIRLNSEGIQEVNMLDNTYCEVTLDCSNEGQGVALGTTRETATEFWFALPPGTIEGGIKISVVDTNNNVFVKETKNNISIPRNEIQPMAALEFKNNGTGDYQLFYTRAEGETAPYDFGEPQTPENLKCFDQYITAHYYDSKNKRFVIQFDEPLTEIKEKAFYEKDLTSIIFPDSVRKIGKEAFYLCVSLKRIIFPGNLNYVDIDAFDECTDLKTLIFLPSPTNEELKFNTYLQYMVGSGAFRGSHLDTLHLNRELIHLYNDTPYDAIDCLQALFSPGECNKSGTGHHVTFEEIVLGNQVKTIHNYMFHYADIKTITIPGSVTTIANTAFDRCYNLESIIFEESSEPLTFGLGDTQTALNCGPFNNCENLKTVVLNRELRLNDYYDRLLNDVTEGIFSNLPMLTDITLGPNVKTIHKYMFSNLTIESITIPNTVTSIGNDAFHGCEALTSLTIPSSVTSIGNDAFRDCTALTSLTIPSSVTSIGSDAFHACSGVKSLTIESGTADLQIGPTYEVSDEYGPFYDLQNLTTLSLDRNLVPTYDIDADEEGLFSEIASLKNVTLGNNVKTIGNRMFLGTGITEITIPSSVTLIDNLAFDECTKLSRIIFSNGSAPLTIGFQPHSDERGPFFDSPLTHINLDRHLVLTDEYQEAQDEWDEGVFAYKYWNDDDLNLTTEVVLGGNVSYISKFMFSGVRLTGCWIPQEVTKIDYRAFHDCEQLRSLSLGGNTPPTLGEEVFDACDVFNTIYVPKSHQNTYKNHTDWKEVIDDHDLTVSYWAGSE